jgi:hypothetical protein
MSTCGPILVRPSINQRANFNINITLDTAADNILFAGYKASSGSELKKDYGSTNSGFAWIEMYGDSTIWFLANGDGVSSGLLFEVVMLDYGSTSLSDRMNCTCSGGGQRNTCVIVGSILNGGRCPAGPPNDCHSDTLQCFGTNGCAGPVNVLVHDSLVFPAWDKVFQGGNECPTDFSNNLVVGPGYADDLWPGSPAVSSQPYHTTWDNATHVDSTTVGGCWGPSMTLDSGEYVGGGNCTKINGAAPTTLPPRITLPTHNQLDEIWSP